MSEHIGTDGVPLRHDGTPFPEDPSQWTAEERQYLETYYFGAREEDGHENDTVALVDVPDIQSGDGSQYA